ncbi:MAG: tRNA 2-thiouridine(34) synthase MnmA [Puniceicoccales bacterium]|jgi:tRNA-specific 2-thiouridylase|nr:tRNA 2-thiouridine(34) synthase MnmA [Puniceicoccales bacterium]
MLRGKVAVAMSGGVDSSVSALLLRNAGHEVRGIFMRTWNAEESKSPIGECPWRNDLNDAQRVCEQLGIAFEVVNMIANYRDLVVKDLVEGYRMGRTPNPDILCNARIKFGILKKYAHDSGFEKFATGHYCRILENANGTLDLLSGADVNKDQSYFLAMLSQHQLKNTIFPVGILKKSEVRKLAESAGLVNCKKKDSQGICFLGNVKIQDFLSGYVEDVPGDIVDVNGRTMGRHRGLFRFTIGQRRGMGVPSNVDFAHYVVVGKDLERNQLLVEMESEDSKFLWGSEFFLGDLNFINEPLPDVAHIAAIPRYRDPPQRAKFFRTGEKTARIVFEKPQRALASGQIIAIASSLSGNYSGKRIFGGGILL